MTARLACPSHQRHPRMRRVRRRQITARILPHFTHRQPERRIAPPALRETGGVSTQKNTMPSAGSAPSEPSSRRLEMQWLRGESAQECPELAEKMRAACSSDDDSGAYGYETDTIDGALDDDYEDEHSDESLATFSSAKTIYESADVVRVAAFPSPPFVEREDPTEVDWEAAMPVQWPADLGDLFANNPAGARTWSEVEAAMHRLVAHHAVRDMSHVLSVMARPASRAGARTPAHAAHAPLPLLADAAAAPCFCKTNWDRPVRLKSP